MSRLSSFCPSTMATRSSSGWVAFTSIRFIEVIVQLWDGTFNRNCLTVLFYLASCDFGEFLSLVRIWSAVSSFQFDSIRAEHIRLLQAARSGCDLKSRCSWHSWRWSGRKLLVKTNLSFLGRKIPGVSRVEIFLRWLMLYWFEAFISDTPLPFTTLMSFYTSAGKACFWLLNHQRSLLM